MARISSSIILYSALCIIMEIPQMVRAAVRKALKEQKFYDHLSQAEIYEIDSKKLNFFKSKGFRIDATLREHYFYKGKYFNSYILSLLKTEAGYE